MLAANANNLLAVGETSACYLPPLPEKSFGSLIMAPGLLKGSCSMIFPVEQRAVTIRGPKHIKMNNVQ